MLSEKPWKGEDVVRLLLGLVATVCFGILLGSLLQRFLEALPESEKKMFGLVIGVLAFQGSSLLWISFFLREQKLSWSAAFGFGSPKLFRTVSLALGAAAVVLPIALGMQHASAVFMQRLQMKPEVQQTVQVFRESVAQAAPTMLSL